MGKKVFVLLMVCWMVPAVIFADTAYLRELVDRPSTTIEDATRMITGFKGELDRHSDFESQRRYLQEAGILTDRLSRKGKTAVLKRGELAELAVNALGVKGGIFFTLAKRTHRNGTAGELFFRRYAFKEAVFLELIQAGDIHAAVTGEELISVISRMKEYQEERGMA